MESLPARGATAGCSCNLESDVLIWVGQAGVIPGSKGRAPSATHEVVFGKMKKQDNNHTDILYHTADGWRRDSAVEETSVRDIFYMKEALRQAKKAYRLKETPIGCVIVYGGNIIARGYNRRNTDGSTLAHAEIAAIRKAARVLGDWRLEGCTLYVTLEPCPMCAGAIVQARMDACVIGCMNAKAGCAGSVLNLLEEPRFNHQVSVRRGVLAPECSALMKQFFRELRASGNKPARDS